MLDVTRRVAQQFQVVIRVIEFGVLGTDGVEYGDDVVGTWVLESVVAVLTGRERVDVGNQVVSR